MHNLYFSLLTLSKQNVMQFSCSHQQKKGNMTTCGKTLKFPHRETESKIQRQTFHCSEYRSLSYFRIKEGGSVHFFTQYAMCETLLEILTSQHFFSLSWDRDRFEPLILDFKSQPLGFQAKRSHHQQIPTFFPQECDRNRFIYRLC